MLGLSPECNIQEFVGNTLTTISFSQYSISFYFDEGPFVRVDGSYSYRVTKSESVITQEVTSRKTTVLSLLGSSVCAATRVGRGTLKLELDEGRTLSFIEDEAPYECYHVTIGDKEYHV